MPRRKANPESELLLRHIGYANAMAEAARSVNASTYRYIQHASTKEKSLSRDIDALVAKHRISYMAVVKLEEEP